MSSLSSHQYTIFFFTNLLSSSTTSSTTAITARGYGQHGAAAAGSLAPGTDSKNLMKINRALHGLTAVLPNLNLKLLLQVNV